MMEQTNNSTDTLLASFQAGNMAAFSQLYDIRIAYMITGILGGCIVLIVSFCKAFDIQEENKL